MGQREDILIGFQVIEKTNLGNGATDNGAWYMQNKRPHTDEPLVMWSDDDKPVSRPAEPTDIKQLTETLNKIIELEVETRLEKFLENYNDNSTVNRGLQHFNTRRQDVNRDTGEVKTHKANVRNVNALIHDYAGLRANGELLSLYKETVELHVLAAKHLPRTAHHHRVPRRVECYLLGAPGPLQLQRQLSLSRLRGTKRADTLQAAGD